MAGGVGSRFWPVSTTDFPKQFHDMLGSGSTLIQKTFSRLSKLIPAENILILTNERYNDLVLEQLPMVKQEQVLLEPAMRNTAPCILYASLKIQKQNPNALMVVAPSDHWIEDEDEFSRNLQQCFDFCQKENALMTLGIQPTFPNTGFGYIEFDKSDVNSIKKVTVLRFELRLPEPQSGVLTTRRYRLQLITSLVYCPIYIILLKFLFILCYFQLNNNL
jgi:mannose-1-phosphate guanylyltransferase